MDTISCKNIMMCRVTDHRCPCREPGGNQPDSLKKAAGAGIRTEPRARGLILRPPHHSRFPGGRALLKGFFLPSTCG